MAAQAIATTGHPVEEAIKLTDTPTAGMEEPISIGQSARWPDLQPADGSLR